MEVYNGKIAVTFDELTSTTDGGAVISCSALKGVLRRHPEYRLSKGGGLGQVCRIDFDALRELYRRRFIAKYGDPRKLLADEALRAELDLTIDEAAKNITPTTAMSCAASLWLSARMCSASSSSTPLCLTG